MGIEQRRARESGTGKMLPYILGELEKVGYPLQEVCRLAGLAIKQPLASDELSARDSSTLFNYACYLLASRSKLGHYSVVTKKVTDMLLYCVISCCDLNEVIDRTLSYCELVEAIGLKVERVDRDQLVEIRVATEQPLPELIERVLTVAAMSIFYQLFSWITASDLQLLEVGLKGEAPELPLPTGALQGQTTRYQQPCNRLLLPQTMLDRPVVRTVEQLHQVIDYFPLSLVVSGRTDTSLSERVRGLIEASLGDYQPPIGVEAAAQLVNMSPATLRRKLRAEQSNFSDLLDQCRRDHAAKALGGGELPITAVALKLGFADDRAFRRACQRWFGDTPSAIRQRLESSNTH